MVEAKIKNPSRTPAEWDVVSNERLRFLLVLFRGAFGARFGFACLRDFGDGILAAFVVADAFFTGLAGFRLVGGLRAAFASEGGGWSEDQRRGNDCDSDGTD